MATVRCPRCARRLAGKSGECAQCGPAVAGLLPPSLPWPGDVPWPQARRWLDDPPPRCDRRPLLAASGCLVAALLLALYTLR